MVLLLLLFYTVESLERERSTDSRRYLRDPVPDGRLPVGEGDREQLRRGGDPRGSLLASAIALAVQHTAGVLARAYALIWGLLLVP